MLKCTVTITTILVLLNLSSIAFAQKDSIEYNLQTGLLLATKNQPPYWSVSNQGGRFSTNSKQFFAIAGLKKSTNHNRSFDFGFGLEAVNRFDSKNKLWLQQGYGEIKYSIFKLTAGAKEEVFGVHDTLLSSGSFIWSRNARPIPKITLSTPGFLDVPYTNRLFGFNASITHGWFEKDRYVENPLLHHKNVYLLFGRKLPIEILLGFDHLVMWGGNSSDPEVGKIPTNWDAFKKAFVAQSSSIHSNERNAFGNHLGAYHLGIKYKFNGNNIFLYKQHPYEDNSGLRFRNWEDGLWGISARLKNKFVKGIIYEYVNTKDQGIEGNYTGKYDPDNYYNNFIYQNGWTVDRWVIGTPFVQSQQFSNTQRLFDNMLQAHYYGIAGQYKEVSFLLNYHLVNFYGNIFDQYENPKKQFTYYLQSSFPVVADLSLRLALCYEHGDLYGKNICFLIRFCYQGFNKCF